MCIRDRPHHLSEIVIKIACFIGIIQYEEYRTPHLPLQRSKEHRSRRAPVSYTHLIRENWRVRGIGVALIVSVSTFTLS